MDLLKAMSAVSIKSGDGSLGSVLTVLDNYASVDMAGANGIVHKDDTAYVVGGVNGYITAIDISNPEALTEVNKTPANAVESYKLTTKLAIDGIYLYSSSSNNSEFSITDSNTMTITGSVYDTLFGNSLNILAKKDRLNAFVRTANQIISVYVNGVTIPAVNQIKSFSYMNTGISFAISDDKNALYTVPSTTNIVYDIDVTDPSDMVLAATLNTSIVRESRGAFVLGELLFITSSTAHSMSVFDVSDPAAIVLISTLVDSTNLFEPEEIEVIGDVAFVVHRTGLTSVDVSDPYNMTVKFALLNVPSIVIGRSITIKDDSVAFVTSEDKGSITAISLI